MAVSTRGLVFGGAGRPLEIEGLVLDEPQRGEVLVRMLASGVCHSDLHVVDGEWERPANVVLGHEGAAIVEAIGPDVPNEGPREGDLVVLAWTAPCGTCTACGRAEPWLCTEPRRSGHRLREEDVRLRRTDGTPIGVYSGIGTFGERQVVAHQAAIPIAQGTPPEIAALIGCAVTTGFGAVVNTAGVRAGESVVIIGAGGVGLSAVMGARFADAGTIVVIDMNPEKLELARGAGATHVLQPSEADAVGDLTDGGADHVLEAIGLTETVEQAIELVRPGGTVTLVGMTPQGRRASFDVYRFVEDGKQLRGSNYGSATPRSTSRGSPRSTPMAACRSICSSRNASAWSPSKVRWRPCDAGMARDGWSCTDEREPGADARALEVSGCGEALGALAAAIVIAAPPGGVIGLSCGPCFSQRLSQRASSR